MMRLARYAVPLVTVGLGSTACVSCPVFPASMDPLAADPAAPILAIETLPAAGDPYHHAATLAALPDGSLLVAWTAGQGELALDTRIVASRRPPGPDSAWSAPETLADFPQRPDANPVLFLDDAGRLHLFRAAMFGATFCDSLILARYSDDFGVTWSPDRLALPAVCTLIRNRPIALDDGRWLLPAYFQAIYASQLFLSADRGRTWWPASVPLLTLPHNNLQPAVVQRSDGSLFGLARGTGGFVWQLCADGPAGWRVAPRDDLRHANSGLDLLRLSSGHLVVALNPDPPRRSPLAVALSADEGRTWRPARTLQSGDGQFSYPALLETPNGLIHCVYSHRLEAIGHAVFNRAWLESP